MRRFSLSHGNPTLVISVSPESKTPETRMPSFVEALKSVMYDCGVTSGTTVTLRSAVENTPTCLASTSYENISPSASQVGSDDIVGSVVAATGTASFPSGRSETNANGRPSLACPW